MAPDPPISRFLRVALIFSLAFGFLPAPNFSEEGSVDSASQPVKQYGGKTLEEWRREIKDLSPDNPAHRDAVPALIEIIKDAEVPWFTRSQVANTLGRMGKLAPEGVPVLVRLLDEAETADHAPRVWAGKALALYGPLARQAAPRLVEILKNEKLPLAERQVAIDALGQIGGAHPRAIPALVETLNLPRPADSAEDEEKIESLRELAVESIAFIGPDAAIAVPVLLRNLNHESESFRRKTAAALGRIGSPAQLAIPTLIEVLAFDESPAVRDAAETALAGIGQPALPALMHLLGDEDPELRQRGARALGAIKKPAAAAVPKLRERLKDADPHVRFAVAKSLWEIQGTAGDSLPVFVETLKSPDRQLRMQAFRVLTTELGEKAAPARENLRKLKAHPDASVRQAAQRALERIPAGDRQKSAD